MIRDFTAFFDLSTNLSSLLTNHADKRKFSDMKTFSIFAAEF